MKKLLCLALVLACCLSAIGTALAAGGEEGCGYGFNATGDRIVDDEITIRVMYQRDSRMGNFDEYWFINYLAEKTGIRLEFDLVEKAAWNERVAIAFATDDYPDIFLNGITPTMVSKYASDGYLVDLAPYIKKYATFTVNEYNKYPEIVKQITGDDGSIYYMPSINACPRSMISEYPIWINYQWLKNLDLQIPTTLDELYEVLCAFKNQDANLDGDPNNEIPVLTRIGSDRFSKVVLTALGYVDSRNAVVDGKYVFVPTTENYKVYLKYMNKCFTEGLIDSEYFTMTSEAQSAKEGTGLVGLQSNSPYYALPDSYEDWRSLPPLTSEYNSQQKWPAQSACNTSWGVCVVTDKCKYVEAVVRMIDWFMTTEGSRAVRAGCEYGTFTDEKGVQYGYEITVPAEETENGHLIAKLHMGDYSNYWACRLAEIGPCNLPFNSTDAVNDIVIAGDVMNLWCYDQVVGSGAIEVREFALPVLTYTDEENNELSTYLDLTNYVDSMEAKFINGSLDIDENWDSFQAQMKKYGIEKMCSLYQNAYDRYLVKAEQIVLE